MAKTWKQEMDLDGELTPAEKDIFIEKITAAGVPSLEEYAEKLDKSRDEVMEKYFNKYGGAIQAARDAATAEAKTVVMTWTNAAGIAVDHDVDFAAAVALMDDEIREKLHAEMAPCSNQSFIDAYCKAHKTKFGEDFKVE